MWESRAMPLPSLSAVPDGNTHIFKCLADIAFVGSSTILSVTRLADGISHQKILGTFGNEISREPKKVAPVTSRAIAAGEVGNGKRAARPSPICAFLHRG